MWLTNATPRPNSSCKPIRYIVSSESTIVTPHPLKLGASLQHIEICIEGMRTCFDHCLTAVSIHPTSKHFVHNRGMHEQKQLWLDLLDVAIPLGLWGGHGYVLGGQTMAEKRTYSVRSRQRGERQNRMRDFGMLFLWGEERLTTGHGWPYAHGVIGQTFWKVCCSCPCLL